MRWMTLEQNIKSRVLSGIQPTGGFTLGNYIGALRNWDKMQQEFDCVYCIVDLHSLTIRNDPKILRNQIRESCAMLLAVGIDPKKSILFIQSDVPAHAELAWILSCYTQFGELSRMTQFKDKSLRNPENINAGLFTYPVLMAADILLYDADLVPIGDDQKQHMELARDIAMRFNGLYGDVFRIPDGYYPEVGGRVMSLQQPTSKMSKSDENDNAKIMLTDNSEIILKKFKRAITDSDNCVRASVQDKPGIYNLMSIYSAVTGRSFDDIEREFEGRGYGDFKTAVGNCVAETLAPIQKRYRDILSDQVMLNDILSQGALRAQTIANSVLTRVRRAVGLT